MHNKYNLTHVLLWNFESRARHYHVIKITNKPKITNNFQISKFSRTAEPSIEVQINPRNETQQITGIKDYAPQQEGVQMPLIHLQPTIEGTQNDSGNT